MIPSAEDMFALEVHFHRNDPAQAQTTHRGAVPRTEQLAELQFIYFLISQSTLDGEHM